MADIMSKEMIRKLMTQYFKQRARQERIVEEARAEIERLNSLLTPLSSALGEPYGELPQ